MAVEPVPASTTTDRRRFLTVGACAGLTLADVLRRESRVRAATPKVLDSAKAKSVIFIFLPGGVPQQDSFDAKPDSPIEYRGSLQSIATRIPGCRFSDYFPKMAEAADKFTVVRSLAHDEPDHDRGKFYLYSGNRPSPAVQYPSVGSIVSFLRGPQNSLPPYVWYPNDPDQFPLSGFLNSAYNPFSLGSGGDPGLPHFAVKDLALPDDLSDERFDRRRRMLDRVNQQFVPRLRSEQLAAVDHFYERAYAMVTSPEARAAFQISRENVKLRDRYGMNSAGQGLLLARRLVESGVRFVSLNFPAVGIGSAGPWDLHIDGHFLMRDLAPPIDQAFAALMNDLDDRGLLDSTLVVLATEFGRAPKINETAGRDHWSKVFSIVLAGGGVRRGLAYGMSDPTAAEPASDRMSVEDLVRTMYHAMGIDADDELMAPGDRPLKLVNGGRVVEELLA